MKYILYLSSLFFVLTIASMKADAGVHSKGSDKYSRSATFSDSTLVLIPFDYKQSALYHQYTFDVIDSVAAQLLKNDSITLTILGYAHPDEGSDTICKYLSLNRALFVRDYMLGRGVDPSRIILVKGMGKIRSKNSDINKDGHKVNCKAEIRLNFPPPPKPVVIADKDGDGIADADDTCPDVYGYEENKGCPDSAAIIIPFQPQQASLEHNAYVALDAVVDVLKANSSYKVSIQGHAYKTEGINAVCDNLAKERSEMVKNYLLSRNIGEARIISIKALGNKRPLNAGKNEQEIADNSRAVIFLTK